MLTGRADLISVSEVRTVTLLWSRRTAQRIGLHAAYACLETDTTLIGADCGCGRPVGPLLEPDIPAYVAELESARAVTVPPATRP